MPKTKKIFQATSDSVHAGGDKLDNVTLDLPGHVTFDKQGRLAAVPRLTLQENWELLPVITTVAATSAKYTLVTGTNAASADITRATKGGIKVAQHGSASDSTVLNFQTNTSGVVALTSKNQVAFKTQVSLGSLAGIIARFGLAVSASTTDPGAIAGAESVQFVFDYANVMTTGLTSAVYQANWLAVTKTTAAGATVFTDTGVGVTAGDDYELVIKIGTDLKPKYYINGALVYTGVTALTTSTMVATLGIKSSVGTDYFECRYVDISRVIG